MRYRELPGWAEALKGAKEIFTHVTEDVWEAAGEREAHPGTTFCAGPNVPYSAACDTRLVKFRRPQ